MLGRAVATLLIERGDDVTVMQRRPAGLAGREILGDVIDGDACSRAARGQDAVIHLAAKVDVIGSWPDYRRANIDGTAHLLHAARRAGTGRFVYVSSPSVAHDGQPLVGAGADPADPASARGHYARSKAGAERLALAAADESLSTVAIRPHLVWGPGDTQLIGRVVERARAGRLALVGTGTALIDTTYVANAAEAIVAGLDRSETLSGQAFVVSNGEPRTIAEIIARVCAAAGVDAEPRRIPYPVAWAAGAVLDSLTGPLRRVGVRGDPPITRFLAEQLGTAHWFAQQHTREQLRWQPRVSLDEGFARLQHWFTAQTRTDR